jgi:hypothetical protein
MQFTRWHRCRTLAGACVLVVSGLSQAAAQFPPAPGQANSGGVFPPPPGAQQSGAFPPPPGPAPAQRQDSAFPPPPTPGQASAPGRFVVPSANGGFSGGAPSANSAFSGGAPPSAEAQKVCLTFPSLREDAEKGAGAIKAAGERKATREEVCPLFKAYALKEAKMLKFLEINQQICGIPATAIAQVKTNHANTIRIRGVVCSAAPQGAGAAPTLSDALGGPIIADDESAKKPGRGTFDTLMGNALQR